MKIVQKEVKVNEEEFLLACYDTSQSKLDFNSEYKMNGILLYTTGDSEGSLGGLVSLGKPGLLDNVVNNALLNSTWCSSDPICSEAVEQGPEGCNKAACHNCALVAETCCENGNRLLDRNLLINPDYGFFRRILKFITN